MSELSGLDDLRPGVYRLGAGLDVDDLDTRLTEQGWTTGRVEQRPGMTGDRKWLLDAIGKALSFPRWYGANLDALADCLTELTRPTALLLPRRIGRIGQADYEAVLEVLRERTEADDEPFAVVVA